MKVRNGFVSNSSSSSFIIRDKEKQEKVKEVIDKTECLDYYEFEGVLYTAFIGDWMDEYSEIYNIIEGCDEIKDIVDGSSNYPYDEDEFVELEGDRGCASVWIDKEVIKHSKINKFWEELRVLNNNEVNNLLTKYDEVLRFENQKWVY